MKNLSSLIKATCFLAMVLLSAKGYSQSPCNFQVGFNTTQSGSSTFTFVNISIGVYTNVSWNFGDGTFSTDPTATHQYNYTGSAYVILQVTDSVTGCSDTTGREVQFTYQANMQTDTLCGQVFNDANGNGIFDLGEITIPNATVTVDLTPYTTDASGFFNAIVDSGTHAIAVVLPSGWQQTYPVSPVTYTITTNSPSHICGFDFGIYLQSAHSGNCYSFDDVTVPAGNRQQAFNIYGNGHSGFLQDWNVTSGTPEIKTSAGNIAAYDGTQFAEMAVCDAGQNNSEGLSLHHTFLPGQSYRVSMAIRNLPVTTSSTTPIDVKFILLQNAINYTYNSNTGCSNTPAIPAGAITVNSITNYSQNSWSVISFTISGLTATYSDLWIRSAFSAGAPLITTGLCIDSVCIEPIATAVTSTCYSFDDYTVPPGNQQQAFNIYGNGHTGFLQDWNVTSGTPSIQTNVGATLSYDGSQFAVEGVCDVGPNSSEGLSLHHVFEPGQTYTVSMAVRNTPVNSSTPNPIDVNFVLLQNPISYTYNPNTGCSNTPAIPSGAVTVHTITSLAQNGWSVISFTISGLTATYSDLWIRSSFSAGSSLATTVLCLDSVCITQQPQVPTADCYTFEETQVPSEDQQQAFDIYGNGHPGFLQDWNVASGTPSIQNAVGSVTAYEGNQFALIGVCDGGPNFSEGLTLNHSFLLGKSYQVSMAVRNVPVTGPNSTPIDVNFILLQNPIAYAYNPNTGCSNTPAVPSGSLTVNSITNYAQNSWSVISFTISNLNANYSQLWFRCGFSSGSPLVTTAFCFDSLCIKEIPNTSNCYSFEDSIIPNGNQQQAFNIYGNGHSGFLQDWNVVSGTPSIQTSVGNITAYEGSQFALQGVCGQSQPYSEGVSLHHNFVHGQSYTVSMAIVNVPISGTNPTPIDINFILLHNPIAYTYNSNTGCSPTPAVPVGAVTVNTISNFTQSNWSVISFTISNLTSDFSELWFKGDFSSGAPLLTTAFCFDSVCITDGIATVNAINETPAATDVPQLFQNTTNPFTGQTTISYYLPEGNNNASLTVYDVTGKLIKQYELKNAGKGSVIFTDEGFSAGMYLYSLAIDDRKVDTKRMLLVK